MGDAGEEEEGEAGAEEEEEMCLGEEEREEDPEGTAEGLRWDLDRLRANFGACPTVLRRCNAGDDDMVAGDVIVSAVNRCNLFFFS